MRLLHRPAGGHYPTPAPTTAAQPVRNRPLGAAHRPGDRVWIVDEQTGVGRHKTVVDTIPMVDLVFADGTRHCEPADMAAARKSNEWTARHYQALAHEAAKRGATPVSGPLGIVR